MKRKLRSVLIIALAVALTLIGKLELPEAAISATTHAPYQLMYLDGVVRTTQDDTGVNEIVTQRLTQYYGAAMAAAYLNAESTGDFTAFYTAMGSTQQTYRYQKLMTNQNGVELSLMAYSGGQDIEYTLHLTGLTSISDLRSNALASGYPNTIDGMRAYADDVYDKKVPKPTTTSSTTTKTKKTATASKLDYTKVFDAKYYAAKYPDLAKAGITSDAALLKHFKSTGIKELRQGNAEFNPVSYIQNNADLVASFGTDYPKYYEHYMKYGYKEQRVH